MTLVWIIALSVCAYLLGTIPFGLIVANRVMGVDIRDHGSRNVGGTNVFRIVGKKWGILVMVLDAVKGAAAVNLTRFLAVSDSSGYGLLFGVLAILGHTFPVWLGFKGGKGVATSLGVFLAYAPLPTLVAFGIWWLVFLPTHIISIASLAAAFAFPITIFLFRARVNQFAILFGISLALAVFIIYTHRANIGRIIKGEEKKLF